MKYLIAILMLSIFIVAACAPASPPTEVPTNVPDDTEVPAEPEPTVPDVTETPTEVPTEVPAETPPTPTPNMTSDVKPGRLVVTVTDARANMSQIEAIHVTFTDVEVLRGNGNWVSVRVGPVTYDLIELDEKNISLALSDMMVPAGTYTHIRFIVNNITVTDVNGTHDAFLPSGIIKTDADFQIRKDDTSLVSLDFLADKSVHIASERYVFAPVFKLETRLRADVVVDDDGVAHVTGGIPKTVSTIGMDVNGNVGGGKSIPASNVFLEDGRLKIKSSSTTTTGWVTAE